MDNDMVVDLGTATTLVYVPGHGIILDEPSVVAIDVRTGESVAFGAEAWRVIGSSPAQIQALRPLRHRAMGDSEVCKTMLQYFIVSALSGRFGDRQRLVICVPSGLTGHEKAALREAGEQVGPAKQLYLIEAPMAAALGAGMPVGQPSGNLVVDIGRDATDVALISVGGIVSTHRVNIGGDELDHAIQSDFRKRHRLLLGERTAEEIKIKLGSACMVVAELRAEVRGRSLDTGLPTTVVTSRAEIAEAISEGVRAVVGAVQVMVDRSPPELAADIMERGIVLTGGGALLNGLDVRLNRETGMPIAVADNPLHSVVIGGANFLQELE